MQATGVYIVGKGALLPQDERARDMIAKLKTGDRVLVKVHRARNPEHNALAHAVFDRIAAATGVTPEEIKLELKVRLGYVDIKRLPFSRKHIAKTRSLAFESMSQDEFQAFWDTAWVIISEEFLPGIPQKDFDEIRAIVVGKA